MPWRSPRFRRVFRQYDREQAAAFAREWSLRHEFIETREIENPLYAANQPDRCYHCKNELFGELGKLRAARGFAAVAYGVNADDLGDFRPGHRAAREHGVAAPLLDAGLTKAEIRELSRSAGLSTWDRPASACLASRIPYGIPVNVEELARIERAESVLRELGFRQFRVRAHGELARIEVAPEELPKALQLDVAQSDRVSLAPGRIHVRDPGSGRLPARLSECRPESDLEVLRSSSYGPTGHAGTARESARRTFVRLAGARAAAPLAI